MSDRDELEALILMHFNPSPYVGSSWKLNPGAAADEILHSDWLAAHDAQVKAEAWDEGAAANWDGQDLRYPNPYRNGDNAEATDSPTCIECGGPSTYRLGRPSPSWCDDHGPHRGDNR